MPEFVYAETMKLLIIGGTRFVGRHLVAAALARDDQVTLFNRGQTSAALPPGVAWIQGDRGGDLSALRGQRWDAVIDTCGYLPADVARMAGALDASVGRFAFISSVSVYASSATCNHEDSPLGHIDDTDTTVVDGRTYGPLKALCEQAVVQRCGTRALIVRPGLVVGPHDPTKRFTWWPARVARAVRDGQPMLAPGAPGRPLQFIDARDLADFVLHALDAGCGGAYNAVAPGGFTTMQGLLDACAVAAGGRPSLVWANDGDLARLGVEPWMQMPLWLPEGGEHAAFMLVDQRRAQAAGLRQRDLGDTVADTLAWWRALPTAQQQFDNTGLSPEREAQVLAALADDRQPRA